MINYAVFKKTFFSKILFHYLNVKSVLLWSIWGEGGFLHMASFRLRVISYPIAAIKLILRGDWNQLSDKLINKGMKPFTRYLNSRNVGS